MIGEIYRLYTPGDDDYLEADLQLVDRASIQPVDGGSELQAVLKKEAYRSLGNVASEEMLWKGKEVKTPENE